MSIMLTSEYFDQIISDLEYVKEFKTPYILFTSKKQIIGLGEGMSYLKIELGIDHPCYLSDMLIETKSLAKILKKVKEESLTFDFIINPLMITTPIDVSIATGLAPKYIETGVIKFFEDFNRESYIVTEEIKLNDTPYWNMLKKLKAEEGIINMPLDDILIPLNKKLLPVVATDIVQVQGYKSVFGNYHYIIFKTTTKTGYRFETYIKVLKV